MTMSQAEGIQGIPTPPAGNGHAPEIDPKAIQGVTVEQPTPAVQPAIAPAGSGRAAVICPLDSDWRLRTYDKGESTCLFLRETLKQGADERLSTNPVYVELHALCKDWIAEERIAVHKRSEAGMPRGRGDHLRVLLTASASGSTLDQRVAAGERMAATRKAKVETRDAGTP
jgi:hypothetical protein